MCARVSNRIENDQRYEKINRDIGRLWNFINKRKVSLIDFSVTSFVLNRSLRKMAHIEILKSQKVGEEKIKIEIGIIEKMLVNEVNRLKEKSKKLEFKGFINAVKFYIISVLPPVILSWVIALFLSTEPITLHRVFDIVTIIGSIFIAGFFIFLPVYGRFLIVNKYKINNNWIRKAVVFGRVKQLFCEDEFQELRNYFPRIWVDELQSKNKEIR